MSSNLFFFSCCCFGMSFAYLASFWNKARYSLSSISLTHISTVTRSSRSIIHIFSISFDVVCLCARARDTRVRELQRECTSIKTHYYSMPIHELMSCRPKFKHKFIFHATFNSKCKRIYSCDWCVVLDLLSAFRLFFFNVCIFMHRI